MVTGRIFGELLFSSVYVGSGVRLPELLLSVYSIFIVTKNIFPYNAGYTRYIMYKQMFLFMFIIKLDNACYR